MDTKTYFHRILWLKAEIDYTRCHLLHCLHDPCSFSEYFSELRNSFGEFVVELGMRSEFASSAFSEIARIQQCSLLFLECFGKEINDDEARQPLAEFIKKLREIDETLRVVLLPCDFQICRESLEFWDAHGVVGIIDRSQSVENIKENVEDLIESEFKLKSKQASHYSCHQMALRLASLEQAIVAESLNVGREGLFLREVPQGARVGDEVEISFHFSQRVSDPLPMIDDEARRKIDGDEQEINNGGGDVMTLKGRIEWLRQHANESVLPEGIGVKYIQLGPKIEEWLKNYVAKHAVDTKIPLS